ncbi:MAG: dihydrodipicolinate synthase family protein, partial [Candidatus Poribacteria bacterium]|nr:dihydrodipicolinate synthase family protein [Candidatus Poribacteria bacterium]
RVAGIVADQSQGRVKNIMHVGAPTTARSAKMAEHAAKVGVEAICCVPPFFYRRSDDEIVEHYRIVAAAADLPLFLYNLPSATGVEITLDLARKIQEKVPQLKGLKHSSSAFGSVRAFAKMGLNCLIGNCQLMLPALTLGASGCVDGPPNMVPKYFVEIWHAYRANDLKRAELAQDKASEVVQQIFACGGGFHALAKVVLGQRLGIDCGDPRQPAFPLTSKQKDAVSRCLESLSLDNSGSDL